MSLKEDLAIEFSVESLFFQHWEGISPLTSGLQVSDENSSSFYCGSVISLNNDFQFVVQLWLNVRILKVFDFSSYFYCFRGRVSSLKSFPCHFGSCSLHSFNYFS